MASDRAAAPRVPVTLVAGLRGAGKSSLIARWLAARPPGHRWALLLNEHGRVDPREFDAPDWRVLDLAGGCACCAALPVLRARLPGLLREGPWQRIWIEVDGGGHVAPLIDELRRAPWSTHLRVDTVEAVVDGSRPAWYRAAASEPGAARARLLEPADRIWLNRATEALPGGEAVAQGSIPADDGAPRQRGLPSENWRELIRSLPFERAIVVDDDRGDARAWMPTALPEPAADPARIERRWLPDLMFDRARLADLFERAPTAGVTEGAAVFLTRREAYRWSLEGGIWRSVASTYRRESRLSIALDSDSVVDSIAAAGRWADTLAGAAIVDAD